NRYQDVDRAACWPWKASLFSRRQVWAVTNHDSRAALATIFSWPATNQRLVIHILVHLRTAGQVLVESCAKVLDVIVPCEFGRVLMIQFASHADVVLFPIPWPLEMACPIGPTPSSPFEPRRRT